MHRRTAPRLARILACAAVPVMLVAAGCSSGSESKKTSSTPSASASAPSAKTSGTPSVSAVKYAKLPDACKSLSGKTIDQLVPKAKNKGGEPFVDGCSWNGLNDYQFRFLNITFNNLSADPNQGSGDKRAQEFADDQVQKVSKEDGAKNAKIQKAGGVGDSASTVSTVTKNKDGDEFQNESVVARTGNVVITLKFSGTGYEGAKAPDASDMMKNAKNAAKEAVAAVAAANKK